MTVAIIVGTGFGGLGEDGSPVEQCETPFGDASGKPLHARLQGTSVIVLPRHGQPHRIAPHRINYRANLWLLRELGAECVLATNTVGGIARDLAPGAFVIPDQIIDYTWGRDHTYMDEPRLEHVDFTHPFDARTRTELVAAARAHARDVTDGGVYGCTQGPRLESAAEIERMARDGCSIVGMTGMPEAALARELSLNYAACAVVTNAAAGRGAEVITMTEIEANLKIGTRRVRILLEKAVPLL